MVQVIQSQALHLHPIDENPGLLPVWEGQAFISYDKWTIVKKLDLSLICDELKLNINRYVSLKNDFHERQSKIIDLDFIEVEKQTDYIMNITFDKFKQLIPLSRAKRGLINPLGTIIKTITGNLDNDDAVRYENRINELKTKQAAIANKMTIVSEIVGTFTNIANSTISNFMKIKQSFQNIDSNLNLTRVHQNTHEIIHIYNAFLHNFQTLYIRLNEIETAVAFSRIKVLHQSIVDTDEFLQMLNEIEKSDKLLFPANLENVIKLEQCTEIKAYIKQNQITFIIQVPLIRNEMYNYFKLLPIPVFNSNKGHTTLILPKYPYVLVKGLKTKSLSQPCSEIDEDRFLCFENDASPLTTDDCVMALLQFSNNTSSCQPVPVITDDLKIDLVQPNRWIIYTNVETLLTRYCENEITQEDIQGTYLLTINDDCRVTIKGVTLRRHQSKGKDISFKKLPILQLPKVNNPTLKSNPINLNGIDLADVGFLNYLLQKSRSELISDNEFSDSEKYQSVFKGVSIGNIVLWLVLISVAVIIGLKHRFWNVSRTRDNPSDDLELDEGGVTSSRGTIYITAA